MSNRGVGKYKYSVHTSINYIKRSTHIVYSYYSINLSKSSKQVLNDFIYLIRHRIIRLNSAAHQRQILYIKLSVEQILGNNCRIISLAIFSELFIKITKLQTKIGKNNYDISNSTKHQLLYMKILLKNIY